MAIYVFGQTVNILAAKPSIIKRTYRGRKEEWPVWKMKAEWAKDRKPLRDGKWSSDVIGNMTADDGLREINAKCAELYGENLGAWYERKCVADDELGLLDGTPHFGPGDAASLAAE